MAATLHWQDCCDSDPPITQPCCLPNNTCIETTVQACADAGGTLHTESCGPIGPPSPPCFDELGRCNCLPLQVTPQTVMVFLDQVVSQIPCCGAPPGQNACISQTCNSRNAAVVSASNLSRIAQLVLVNNAECANQTVIGSIQWTEWCFVPPGTDSGSTSFTVNVRAPIPGLPNGYIKVRLVLFIEVINSFWPGTPAVTVTNEPESCGGSSTTLVFPSAWRGPCGPPCLDVFAAQFCSPIRPNGIAVW